MNKAVTGANTARKLGGRVARGVDAKSRWHHTVLSVSSRQILQPGVLGHIIGIHLRPSPNPEGAS